MEYTHSQVCVFHNWQRETSPTQYVQPSLIDFENVKDEFRPGTWRNLNPGGLSDVMLLAGHNNYLRQAVERRDHLQIIF
jgi:hypothetical protein